MLNKLEKKIILTNMILVGIVIFTVLMFMCITSNNKKKKEINENLKDELNIALRNKDNDEQQPPPPNGPDRIKNINNIVVEIENSSEIDKNSINIITTNEYIKINNMVRVVKKVIKDDNIYGIIEDDEDLYYMKGKAPESKSTYIIFCSYSGEIKTDLEKNITLAIQMGVLAMLAFFLISIFLAKIAVTPVQEVWDQQQEFIANASHELKTPLTVMLANHNILQSHPEETIQSQKKWFDSTYAETIHMKKLVEDLLFLARSDAKRTVMKLEEIDISERAISILLQFEPVAFEKNVNMDYNVVPNIKVKGDETQIKQLIHILLDNALKYAGINGQVFLSLQVQQNDVVLAVNNTGKVIPEEDIEHLFERFYRSDKARSMEGGYGLGLSIAKTITDNHKGVIGVSSDEYYGTTFTVKIPCVNLTLRKNKSFRN